jgi:hypothetical protein
MKTCVAFTAINNGIFRRAAALSRLGWGKEDVRAANEALPVSDRPVLSPLVQPECARIQKTKRAIGFNPIKLFNTLLVRDQTLPFTPDLFRSRIPFRLLAVVQKADRSGMHRADDRKAKRWEGMAVFAVGTGT